jgi:hypothetical protein
MCAIVVVALTGANLVLTYWLLRKQGTLRPKQETTEVKKPVFMHGGKP